MGEIERYGGRKLDGGNVIPVLSMGQVDGLVTAKDRHDEIAAGDVPGAKAIFAPGYNEDVGNTLEDITPSGLVVIPVPPAATLMEVVSSAVGDAPGGAGTTAVAIHGLSDAFVEQSEILELDGQTPVPTVLAYRRINALHSAANTGAGVTAAGNIDIRNIGTPAIIYSRIATGGNMSLQAHYTVPAGKVGFISGWSAGAVAAQSIVARAILRATCNWGDRSLMSGIFLFQDIMAHSAGTSQRQFKHARRIPAMADVKVSGQRMLGAQTIQVSCSFDMWIEDE